VVAARVGAAEITVEDLIRFATLNPQRVRTLADGPEGKAEVLRLLIMNVLLQQEMARQGLLPDGNSDPQSHQSAYELLAKEHFPAPADITEAELRAFYEQNPDLFGIPAATRISQIQFRFPQDADDQAKSATERRAQQALARLEAGEDFAAVAADVTENENAKDLNGDLGFIDREQWSPWLASALDGIEAGEHTGAIPSPIGYEILKVTETREAVTSPFDDVRSSVKRRLQAQRQAELRDAYVKQLAEHADIEIELDDIRPFFTEGVFP
jgi:parvulin-like peptidyl-prolyl isomerase